MRFLEIAERVERGLQNSPSSPTLPAAAVLPPRLPREKGLTERPVAYDINDRNDQRSYAPLAWRTRFTEEQVLAMNLEAFRKARIAVPMFSEVVGEEIVLVSDEAILRTLEGDGRAVYLPEEILALEGQPTDRVCALHATKKLFGGTIKSASLEAQRKDDSR